MLLRAERVRAGLADVERVSLPNALVRHVQVVARLAALVYVGGLRGELALGGAVALLGDLLREIHPAVVLAGETVFYRRNGGNSGQVMPGSVVAPAYPDLVVLFAVDIELRVDALRVREPVMPGGVRGRLWLLTSTDMHSHKQS